jgi:hypothetical protein
MKYFLAALGLFAADAALAAPAVPQATGGLRQTLQQYHSTGTPGPRQLSAIERAELRRQISESARPVKRRGDDKPKPSTWKKEQ